MAVPEKFVWPIAHELHVQKETPCPKKIRAELCIIMSFHMLEFP